ncbi:MAG: YfcE family phosphodiesterase [Promethearchaeia archaeon]
MTKITVLGDTHLRLEFEDLPGAILDAIYQNEYLFHVGDYVVVDIIDKLIELKGDKFYGVYGNADTLKIRTRVPSQRILQIDGKIIGLTHPASGGESTYTEKKALNSFNVPTLDILIYGHTHYPLIEQRDDFLLINPGKGYLEKHYYGPPTSFVILDINKTINAKLISLSSKKAVD